MSQIGVVILIAGGAFAAGFTLALWLAPAAPPTPAGTLAFFASRLLTAAATMLLALDIYAAIRRQTLADKLLGETFPADFSERLASALTGGGVLLLLAAVVAVLGARLPAK